MAASPIASTPASPEQRAREEFINYFRDLKAENEREGSKVNKSAEWTVFIETKVNDGALPEGARHWKCPRFRA